MNCFPAFSNVSRLVLPVSIILFGCEAPSTLPLLKSVPSDSTAKVEQASSAVSIPGELQIRSKQITKLSPRAAVVLDKNCPEIVQPYKLTDNVASLAAFSAKEVISDLSKQIGSIFRGGTGAGAVAGGQMEASTKLAAKQLNWLPMSAEVAFGEKAHSQETALLERDSRAGKRFYPIADAMLSEILAAVEEPHAYSFKLFILKNSTHNAVARPGGFLYLDQGLVEDPSHKPKAYFALAHEVAHVLQRHETKEMQSMVVDSFTVKDDLIKTISNVRSNPNSILAHVKVEKNRFIQHHSDQELQSDSCAARLLGRALPDQKALAVSLNAFLDNLSKPEVKPGLPPPKSDVDKLAQSVHEIVDSPLKRHPNNEERQKNLRAIYAEISGGGNTLARP